MIVKLKDICTFQSGGTPSKTNPSFFGGNIPWISTVALNGGRIDGTVASEMLTQEAIEKSAAKIVPTHSIMVGTRVGIGKVAINNVPMSTSQDIISLIGIDEKNWDKDFLCKLIAFYAPYFNSQARGATIKGIKIDILANIDIPELSLQEQQHISSVIDSVTSNIASHKELLCVYNETIRSRFLEMFGDPNINPHNWEVCTIGEIVTDVRYGTSRPSVDGGKYPYLRMNNLTADGYLDLNGLKYIDIPDNEIEKCIVRKGDVLFNRTNSIELVGKTCVFELDEEMVIAGYIIRVRLCERVLPKFFSVFMNTKAIKEKLRSMAKGAVNQANINAQELQSIKIYLPPIELQQEFIAFVEQVENAKKAVQESLDNLEILKKSLTQKYFG